MEKFCTRMNTGYIVKLVSVMCQEVVNTKGRASLIEVRSTFWDDT